MRLEKLEQLRLIPACAGKTAERAERLPHLQAHPRVCGENKTKARFNLDALGSSPRVRGKRGSLSSSKRHAGLIPACAGKTTMRTLKTDRRGAHPRVCGENAEQRVLGTRFSGSSPRVRGKPSSPKNTSNASGLIPACAGKTLIDVLEVPTRRAHPRVCGENEDVDVNTTTAAGSSPRVRGKLLASTAKQLADRLIPACAGKTVRLVSIRITWRAHPRVCGENNRF